MRTSPLLVLLFALVVPASARIGGTETELTKRYGSPASRRSDAIPSAIFTFDGWMVTCDFIDGVCARVSYAKNGEWTEETFDKLLSANGDRAGWIDHGTPSMRKLARSWQRADGTLAKWVVGCLSITSPRYEKAKALSEIEALMAATST
ncbi:MAG: hypothetical protein ABIZ81_10005 [Opitutaceae bacterium]